MEYRVDRKTLTIKDAMGNIVEPTVGSLEGVSRRIHAIYLEWEDVLAQNLKRRETLLKKGRSYYDNLWHREGAWKQALETTHTCENIVYPNRDNIVLADVLKEYYNLYVPTDSHGRIIGDISLLYRAG
jgi:hypothetical protein